MPSSAKRPAQSDEEVVRTLFAGPIVAFFLYYLLTHTDVALQHSISTYTNIVEMLESHYTLLFTIPISTLDLFGSILSCLKYRESVPKASRKFWLETLVACTLIQFGGTTLNGVIVLGQTPSWILSHAAFPALLLAWWFTFFFPFDLYYRMISSSGYLSWALLLICKVGAAISGGHAVTSWGMDKALFNTSHTNAERIAASVVTCIFAGTISASGGGILADIFGFFREKNSFTLTETPELFKGFSLKHPEIDGNAPVRNSLLSAFLLSSTYYLLLNPSGYLPWEKNAFSKEVGHLVICSLSVANLLSNEIFGLNCVKYIGKFLLMVLHVPSAFVPSRPEFKSNDASLENKTSQQKETFTIVATPTLSENARRNSRSKKSE